MSNHQTIAALRVALKRECLDLRREVVRRAYACSEYDYWLVKLGHEAATERLLSLIEKAVKIAEFYADKKNWGEPTTDIRDWYLIESTDRGKKARDFLAEIEK